MLALFSVLSFSAVVALVQIPPLIRNGLKRELWVFSVLLAIATTACAVKALGRELPNPLDAIIFVYKPLSKLLFGLLT